MGVTAAQAQQQAADSASLGLMPGDIIVTAQKRSENVQDVPIAITAVSGSSLGTLQMRSGTELARQTPNLSVSVLGNEDQPKFSVRGISQSAFDLNASSPTGIFYDEVFVRASFLGGAQLYDMDRVEVLRGPQGTLFGKETVGGAVSYVTRAPEFDTSGYLSGEYGNYNYVALQGAANTQIIDDKLAVRFSFNTNQSDGFVKNLRPGGRDKSNLDKTAFRVTMKYKDDAGFEATLRYSYTRSSPEAVGTNVTGYLPGNTNAFGFDPRIDPVTGRRLGAREGYYDRDGQIRVRGDGISLTMKKDLGSVALTSISSYLKGYFLNEVDGDGSAANLLALDFRAKTKEYSQDLRLTTQFDGPFNVIAGLYYFRDTLDNLFNVSQFDGAFNARQTYFQTRTSYAGYIDGTYEFSPELSAYAGFRMTHDKTTMADFQSIVNIPGLGIPLTTQVYKETQPSGRVGLRYKFSRDVMAYAQFARGYRSGGFNGGAVVFPGDLNIAKPEFLDAYEAGLKTRLFDRRLTLNLSAFHYIFKDQQFINSVSIINQALVNAGRSRINGLEAEITAAITPQIRLSAGMGLLDAKYNTLTLTGVDLAGNRLIEAPRFTMNLAADYTVPLSSAVELTLHGDMVHKSKQFFTAYNDKVFPFSLGVTPAFQEYNARAGLAFEEDRYNLGLWGKNLSNNTTLAGVGIETNTMLRFGTVPYPRRYGIDFQVKF
ncbi:TonB-dependent receptor [Sphingobium sp. Ant17]|uniref:TonB-dependent receptor n=1 Tax=Sphingobium sp. Ant17 TaxID=1461752 RepID=UPI001F4849AD|nr:TonB-dependent receptor [Sphingobium sp. Ant17]